MQFEGKECEETSEAEMCNNIACDQDCVLSDWSPWGTCSQSCKAGRFYTPGMQFRRKHIKVPTRGAGQCPSPNTKERFGWQYCNDFICPADAECVADLDVVVVLDGSGSLWYWRGPKDLNWKRSLKFTEALIKGSKMATVDSEGKIGHGVRFGIISFAWQPKIISPLSEDKTKLLAEVEKMKWPMGATFTGQALMRALQLFRLGGGGKRHQVAVLVTDGRASNRQWALQGANYLRSQGVRLMVVPVGRRVMREKAEMCKWASKPCANNMLPTPKWDMLITKIRRYLATLCPVMESPGKGTSTR